MRGNLNAACILGVEVFQLHREKRRLEFVKARVHPLLLRDIALLGSPAIFAQSAHVLKQPVVVGDDRAAITQRAKIFCRVERKAAQGAPPAHRPPMIVRAVRLGAILNHGNAGVLGNRLQNVKIGRMAVKVHGDDGPRLVRIGLGDGEGVDGVGGGVDIDEHRRCAREHNRGHGGHGGVRHGNHLVTGANVQRAQRQQQRISSRVDAHAPIGVQIGGESILEVEHFITQNVPAALHHAQGGLVQRFLVGEIRCAQVIEWNWLHRSVHYFARFA